MLFWNPNVTLATWKDTSLRPPVNWGIGLAPAGSRGTWNYDGRPVILASQPDRGPRGAGIQDDVQTYRSDDAYVYDVPGVVDMILFWELRPWGMSKQDWQFKLEGVLQSLRSNPRRHLRRNPSSYHMAMWDHISQVASDIAARFVDEVGAGLPRMDREIYYEEISHYLQRMARQLIRPSIAPPTSTLWARSLKGRARKD